MSGTTVTTSGNTGRIYGTTSGITYAATLPIGALATLVTAGDTAKNTATTGMEAKFTTWKTAANAAMTGYKAMIDGDNSFHATTVSTTKGCNVDTGVTNWSIVTLHSTAAAALAAATTDLLARPSNLVAALTGATEAAVNTSCETECKKLPSWGLSITGSGADEIPNVTTEVCQGVENSLYTTGGGNDAAGWKGRCKFISSAKKDAGTVGNFILLAEAATGDNTNCKKRTNTNGLLWRGLVVSAAAWTASNYPAVHASYTGFTGALDTWTTSRTAVILSYKAYLLLKTTCQKIGKSYLDEIVKVTSATARVTGVKGTDITNMNLSDAYEAQWITIYGDTPAVLASLDVAKPYDSLKPTDQSVTGTGTYALWLQAKAATAVASGAHATAKLAW